MTIANLRHQPSAETLDEFLALVPECVREAVRAEVPAAEVKTDPARIPHQETQPAVVQKRKPSRRYRSGMSERRYRDDD